MSYRDYRDMFDRPRWGQGKENDYGFLSDHKIDLLLPELTGKSEKQIQYAQDVRAGFLHTDAPTVLQVAKIVRLAKRQSFAERCAANGTTPEAEVERRIACLVQQLGAHVNEVYWAMTCTDAGELLDGLVRG